ncbi:hypothetical protein BMS3Bbin06_01371 [bacterium BMS3Bbin06]|nr:hypothetical protein BMS3Bbin06_01371 [bacterium BMS3Bbin06]
MTNDCIKSDSLSVIPAVLKPESILFNKFRMSRTLSGHDKNKKWQFIHRLYIVRFFTAFRKTPGEVLHF